MPHLDAVAVITAQPGSEEVVGDALRALVEPSRAEAGCISYDLFESAVTPGIFVTIERWRGPADLDAHMQTAHIGAALAAAGDHMASPPAIHPLTPTGP